MSGYCCNCDTGRLSVLLLNRGRVHSCRRHHHHHHHLFAKKQVQQKKYTKLFGRCDKAEVQH